jgi:hypothetical protein
VPEFLTRVVAHFAAFSPLKKSLFGFACAVFLIELAFRRFARGSAAYAKWTRAFEAVGKVWTAVILSVVYVLSVGLVGLVMKLVGRDPLDRKLDTEPTFWRVHEPNPLGPAAAVRHQF